MHRACLVVSWSSVELVLEMYICPDHDELKKSDEKGQEREESRMMMEREIVTL